MKSIYSGFKTREKKKIFFSPLSSLSSPLSRFSPFGTVPAAIRTSTDQPPTPDTLPHQARPSATPNRAETSSDRAVKSRTCRAKLAICSAPLLPRPRRRPSFPLHQLRTSRPPVDNQLARGVRPGVREADQRTPRCAKQPKRAYQAVWCSSQSHQPKPALGQPRSAATSPPAAILCVGRLASKNPLRLRPFLSQSKSTTGKPSTRATRGNL